MNEVCPNCQRELPNNAPAGLCPNCLMAAGMSGTRRAGPETLSLDGHFNAPQVDELAELFPQLTVVELLGHGGMGAVYRARQNNLDRPVALKILSPRLGRDPSFAERFAREARTMARLNHPNIVTVFDFGQAGPFYFLIMELIEGVNLREAILAGNVKSEEALAIVPKICDALQYAHDEGIVHRDIKPENILIGQRGQVTIADFGLAKLLGTVENSFTLTGTHQILGTRNYMAPEQIEKPQTVDHRADIYSLGVVFYELLTGELPLGRFSLPSEKASINQQLDDVVLRTLEKEPDRRFQQASAVKTAVESIAPDSYRSTPPPAADSVETGGVEDPASSSEPTERSARTSLPWYNDEVHGGLSQVHGIAHLDDNSLELEFRVKRLGISSSTTKRVRIPLSNIIQAEVRKGVFWPSLQIQSGNLETFDEIPGCTQGQLVMYLDKQHLTISHEFCNRLNKLSDAHPEPSEDQSEVLSRIIVKLPMEMAEAKGLAKLTTSSLMMEFQKTDWWGTVQSPAQYVQIPLEGIVAVDYKPGLFSDKINVQTDSLDLVALIPNAGQGKFAMKTIKNDRPGVEDFCRQLIRHANLPLPASLTQTKPELMGDEGRAGVHRALSLARWGLPLSAAFNLVYLCIVAVVNLHAIRDPIDTFVNSNPMVKSVADEFHPGWLHFVTLTNADCLLLVVISVLMTVLAMVAFYRLLRLRSYRRTVTMLSFLALPIHWGAIVSLPAGLWCIFALLKSNAKLHFD